MRSPFTAVSSSPVSLISSPSRSCDSRLSGFSITSNRVGSSIQLALDDPSAVRSICAPHVLRSKRIVGWTVRELAFNKPGEPPPGCRGACKRGRNTRSAKASCRVVEEAADTQLWHANRNAIAFVSARERSIGGDLDPRHAFLDASRRPRARILGEPCSCRLFLWRQACVRMREIGESSSEPGR